MKPPADLLAVLLLVAAAPGAAWAEQFVLVDLAYTHDRTSHKVVKPAAGAPSNWRTPVNYAEGTAHVRVEVMTKPSPTVVNYEICFISGAPINGGYYGCLGARRFTAPTVLGYSVRLPSMWQYRNVDWSRPLREITLIVKDSGYRLVDRADPAFYPMQIRTTITIVSAGATLVDGGTPRPTDAAVTEASAERAERPPALDAAPAHPDAVAQPDAGDSRESPARAEADASRPPASAWPAPPEDEAPSAPRRRASQRGCSLGGEPVNPAWFLWSVIVAAAMLSRRPRRS